MKSGKILLLSLILLLTGNTIAVTVSSAASSMAVPTGQQVFPTSSLIASPFLSVDPSQARPVGVGSAASGGSTVSLEIALEQFSGPVDIYVGIYAPSIDPDNLYLVTSDDALQPLSIQTLTASNGLQLSLTGITPWVTNSPGNINTPLLGAIPVSTLPPGTYYLYLLATPAGRLDSYYLWTTAGFISGAITPPAQAANVLPITVNGALCSAFSGPNTPCVSVTICSPGTSVCQTISNVLVDTGSFGLRIFKQALSVSLMQEAIDGEALAECIQYGDGSSDWGPVQTASLILGNEPAVLVPIQVIDSTFGSPPPACANADMGPSDVGFNGILGVGLFAQDCGPTCASSAENGIYYACGGTRCVGTTVPLSGQVQNPVALLPRDNNGVMVQLPSVPQGGSLSVDGYLVLGIGTESNNVPSAVVTYEADEYGEFLTSFEGQLYSSFIDTGSNGFFFPSPSVGLLPDCAPPNSDWYCPSSIVTLSVTNTGATGSPSGVISFQVASVDSFDNSPNNVFDDIGGPYAGQFDWGLPFFFGRDVFVGLEGAASSLGTGPYWAY
ncbi:MAG TPA: DUF3443 domain-containing protein [Thermodesulfovibrionales bacterium]|nr:DUF3443 domain-containing protein [Thermodesulfovibrionales bacterium]